MSLPLLPGYTFPNPTRSKFHKSQALVFENGGPAMHETAPGIGGTLLPGQAPPKEAISSTSVYNKTLSGSNTQDVGETVPAWVAFGSQVLRFFGYFKEPIFSSQDETYRVRNVIILFFLEDDTIQIIEPKEKNSGIPQGTFLRRHRAKKDDDSFVTVGDFHVGSEFSLYGRVYHISDCDQFTREFLQKLGLDEGFKDQIPEDPYITKRKVIEYSETHRNRGVAKPEMLKLRQFLANDGHVLRFFAIWDNRDRPFGDVRKFVFHYFLADDTMEVLAIRHSNDGRDPSPSFVHRSQIPKKILSLNENDPRFLSSDNYYRPTDLRIGTEIDILGRRMLLFDCDSFTRQWFKDNFGLTDEELKPLTFEQSSSNQTVKFEAPPPSLIGSEEDSLQSCVSLHPKPPPKDQVKMLSRLHDILRFKSHMVTKNRVDASRSFIITLYLCDDSIQIYEPPSRNSGVIAGKWLQRTKLKNPDTNMPYKASDFEIGKVLSINGTRFQIDEATEYAMSFMEADPDEFPQADLVRIVEDLRSTIKQKGENSRELFRVYSDHGRMGIEQLRSLYSALGLSITPHEAMTVMRRYQLDKDVQTFTLKEFLQIAQ